MTRTLLAFSLLTVIGLGGGACGSNSSSSVPSTLGGMCNETGAAFCQSETKCSSISQSQCVTAYVQGCCQDDGKCGNSMPSVDGSMYSKCKSDLASMSCSKISSGGLPDSCNSM